MPKSNVVFIGMPGAGKSTVGVVVAKMAGLDFLDADLVIQNTYGHTLQTLIDQHGPEGFLRLENEALCGIECSRTLIATGGSAVYSEAAMEHLKSLGVVVYLEVSLEELIERLGSLVERGVVMRNGSGTSLADLYAERIPLYQRWADITIPTDGLSMRETAEACFRVLSEN